MFSPSQWLNCSDSQENLGAGTESMFLRHVFLDSWEIAGYSSYRLDGGVVQSEVWWMSSCRWRSVCGFVSKHLCFQTWWKYTGSQWIYCSSWTRSGQRELENKWCSCILDQWLNTGEDLMFNHVHVLTSPSCSRSLHISGKFISSKIVKN